MRGTPAYDMFTSYGQQSCKFLDKWYKDGLFPKNGSFDMDRIVILREGLSYQSRRGEWRAFSCWYGEASERRHRSQAQSLTDIQEKLKAQLADMAAQFSASKDAQRKLADQLAKSKDAREEREAQLAAMTTQLTESKDAQRKLADQLAQSKVARADLGSQVASMLKRLTESEDAQEELEAELAKSKDVRELLESNLASMFTRFTQSEDAQKKLEEQLVYTAAQLKNSTTAQWKLKDQLARSKDAQAKLKAQIAALKSKYDACLPWKQKPSAQILPSLWQRVLEGENCPAVSHATWTPGELRSLRILFPDIRNRPVEFKEALDFIFRFYNPSWREVNWFLGIVIPQRAVREQLLARAQWPATVPGSEVALMLAKQCLLGAVLGVHSKNRNWGLISQCKQEYGETPPDFCKRLKESFEKYSGIPQPMENAPDVMAYAFVQSLQPETLEWLKKFGIEWRATTFNDLVNIADFGQYLEKQEQKRWEVGFEDPAYRMFYDSD